MKSTEASNERRFGNLLNTEKNDEVVHNILLTSEKKKKAYCCTEKKGEKSLYKHCKSVTDNTTAFKVTQLQALQQKHVLKDNSNCAC